MGESPKNFSQAINDLSGQDKSAPQDLRAHLEAEIARLEETLKGLKPHLEGLSAKVSEEARKHKDQLEGQVRSNLWTSLGVVGLICFVIGYLFGSGRNRP